ncbi:double zinc ribbon domain-containing protein [Roseomonas sp. BN140053]|uniref:double zinc ribbon domain-containing protein n=1 Tax=Roseomonas sp. BN140053 TaxID=3391898 RepID=UPI0039E7AF62
MIHAAGFGTLPAAAMAQALRRFGRRAGLGVLDAVLPPHCLSCDAAVTEQGAVCPDCFRTLHAIVAPFCDGCGVPFVHGGQGVPELGGPRLLCSRCAERPPLFDTARAAFTYGEGAKRLLLPFKHGDRPDLARPLARHMARAGAELLDRADLLVPVPLHWKRLLRRRYNQAALLARMLARRSGVPWLPDALRRLRATESLGERGAAEREAVLQGAFGLSRRGAAQVEGRRVLLVDDVLTSGATANACAAALRGAGATAVDVLAVARVPDPTLRETPKPDRVASPAA